MPVLTGAATKKMPTPQPEPTQAPMMALERLALGRKARVIEIRRWTVPRSRYTLCMLERLVRLREATSMTDLSRLMKRGGSAKLERGNSEAGGGANGWEPQGERHRH